MPAELSAARRTHRNATTSDSSSPPTAIESLERRWLLSASAKTATTHTASTLTSTAIPKTFFQPINVSGDYTGSVRLDTLDPSLAALFGVKQGQNVATVLHINPGATFGLATGTLSVGDIATFSVNGVAVNNEMSLVLLGTSDLTATGTLIGTVNKTSGIFLGELAASTHFAKFGGHAHLTNPDFVQNQTPTPPSTIPPDTGISGGPDIGSALNPLGGGGSGSSPSLIGSAGAGATGIGSGAPSYLPTAAPSVPVINDPPAPLPDMGLPPSSSSTSSAPSSPYFDFGGSGASGGDMMGSGATTGGSSSVFSIIPL